MKPFKAPGGSDVQARAIGTAVAVVAIGASMCADAARATFPGAPGRIVSGSNWAADAATTRNPDGTDVREVVPGALVPQWSPDGSKLLYQAAGPNPGVSDSWHAWTVNADGSQPTLLFDPREVFQTPRDGDRGRFWSDHVVDPSWAPDGHHLVFTRDREWEDDDGEHSGSSQRIYTISMRGRALRRLHAGWNPVWSPRGGTIAYLRGSHNSTEIASMRTNGRRVRVLQRVVLARGRVERHPRSLSFSPDGWRLAYIEERWRWDRSGTEIRDIRSYLRILDLRTGKVKEVPSSVTNMAVDVMWRPDGKRIAFLGVSRRANGERSLYSLRANGTDKRLMFPLEHADDVDWQPLPTAPPG